MKPIKKTPKTFLGLGITLLLVIEIIVVFYENSIVHKIEGIVKLEHLFYGILTGGPFLMIFLFGGWRYINKCHHKKKIFNFKFFSLVIFPSLVYVLVAFQIYFQINIWFILPVVILSAILFVASSFDKCPLCKKPLITFSNRESANYGNYNYSIYSYIRCMWCGLNLRGSYYDDIYRNLENIRKEVKNGEYNKPLVTRPKQQSLEEKLTMLADKMGGMDKLSEFINTLSEDEKKKLLNS